MLLIAILFQIMILYFMFTVLPVGAMLFMHIINALTITNV